MGIGAALIERVMPKLKKITIRKLFGFYDYQLDINNHQVGSPRVINLRGNDISIKPMNTTIIHGDVGRGKTTILKLIDAILQCNFDQIIDISFDCCILDFECEEKTNQKRIVVKKEYRDSISKVGRVLIHSAINKYPNIVVKLLDYEINGEPYSVYYSQDTTISKSKRKWTLFNSSNIEEIIENNSFPKSIFIDSQRVYSEVTLEKVSNKFAEYLRDINTKISEIKESFINDIKAYYQNKEIKCIDNELMLEEYEIRNNKMLSFLDKNGWLLFENAILARKKYESNLQNAQLRENTLKNIYNLCYRFIQRDDVKQIEMFLDIMNTQFFNLSNKRLGIYNGELCLIHSKDKTLLKDNFDKYYRDIFYDKIKYRTLKYGYDYDFDNQKYFVIPIKNMSSGEKNLFVLFYELLFNLKENQIMLIDEPEISLTPNLQERIVDVCTYILNSPFNGIYRNDDKSKDFIINGINIDTHEVLEFKHFFATEIIIATQSPLIFKGYENCVIELTEE